MTTCLCSLGIPARIPGARSRVFATDRRRTRIPVRGSAISLLRSGEEASSGFDDALRSGELAKLVLQPLEPLSSRSSIDVHDLGNVFPGERAVDPQDEECLLVRRQLVAKLLDL